MSELHLKKDIYGEQSVKQGIAAFHSFGAFLEAENENEIVAGIAPSKFGEDVVAKELENYIIDLTCKTKQW